MYPPPNRHILKRCVRVHDFLIPGLGRATPYGVCDLAQKTGWASVGVDHDTAAFAVESIRRWWQIGPNIAGLYYNDDLTAVVSAVYVRENHP
jgi:DDE family transposase